MRWVREFSEGSRDQRELLGGKGAGVAEMTRVLGADRVPAGFTITTEACVAYMEAGGELPDGLDEEVDEALAALERRIGQAARRPRRPAAGLGALRGPRLDAGDARHGPQPRAQRRVGRGPRRAAPASERFAWDSYRRFVQMFGNVVRGDPLGDASSERSRRPRSRARRRAPTPSSMRTSLRELTATFKRVFEEATGEPSRPSRASSSRQAIGAVFDSWDGERAVAYRRINGIPDDWGTAVNVQQMVFGNRGETSGSGVAFSRDERTGEPTPSGDFLANAQGEDVVAGTRDPEDLAALAERLPEAHAELLDDLAGSSPTTRTCRTSSSRSRTGRSSCCRRAPPSDPPRRRSASPSTPSRRGC